MPALALSALALVCACLPHPGGFVAMSLAIFSAAWGWVLYRRKEAKGWTRLAGASGLYLGSAALLLATVRVVATISVVEHLIGRLS